MAVKCTECGAAVQDDSKFCRYCGAKIMQDETVEVKKHEYRFETVNHAKIRKEELKAEREAARIKAETERLEQQRKYSAEKSKHDKWVVIMAAAVFIIYMLTYRWFF